MTHSLRTLALLLVLLLSRPAAAILIVETGDAGGPGEDGESVVASGSDISTGDDMAEVIAIAAGGPGGPADDVRAGNGGGAGLGPLRAASDTGVVVVQGNAFGGTGGRGNPDIPAGDGASVRLRNTVDGDTAGPLVLLQLAQGGAAGLGSGGRTGAASSLLHRRKSAEQFALFSQAFGGGIGEVFPRFAAPAAGAPARAIGKGVNDAGVMVTRVRAVAGDGGASLAFGAFDGGAAQVVATGHTHGDGNPVFVGTFQPLLDPDADAAMSAITNEEAGSAIVASNLQAPSLPPFIPALVEGAFGGRGGSFLGFRVPVASPPAGDGGRARSVSVGIAEGDSRVGVLDVAEGGDGGFQIGAQAGGRSSGGPARSSAFGLGGGVSPVSVEASARGGSAGTVVPPAFVPDPPAAPFSATKDGIAGAPASSFAVAMGEGEVEALASAEAGLGTLGSGENLRHPGGPARARAQARGGDGSATAAASSGSQALVVEVSAGASVRGGARVQALVSRPRELNRRFGRRTFGNDALASATVAPGPLHVAISLSREEALRRALEDAGAERIDALGRFASRQRQGAPGDVVRAVFELSLADGVVQFGSLGRGELVWIGLFDPRLPVQGFQSLRVTLENDGDVLLDELFLDPAAAEAFLDGVLLEAGVVDGGVFNPFPPGTLPPTAVLRLVLETTRPGAGLRLGILAASAPEPSSP